MTRVLLKHLFLGGKLPTKLPKFIARYFGQVLYRPIQCLKPANKVKPSQFLVGGSVDRLRGGGRDPEFQIKSEREKFISTVNGGTGVCPQPRLNTSTYKINSD